MCYSSMKIKIQQSLILTLYHLQLSSEVKLQAKDGATNGKDRRKSDEMEEEINRITFASLEQEENHSSDINCPHIAKGVNVAAFTKIDNERIHS